MHGDGLGEAVEQHAQVFQAQDMVMVQVGGGIAEAMVRMRADAFAHDRRLGEVAADVATWRLRFDSNRH